MNVAYIMMNTKSRKLNKSSENAVSLRHLRMTIKSHNYSHTEMESSLDMQNACYHYVKNLWSSPLLSKNIQTKMHSDIICLLFSVDVKLGT